MTAPAIRTNSTTRSGTRARRARFVDRFADLHAQLHDLRSHGTYPLYPVPAPSDLTFCLNDYLGLRQDPRVIAAAQDAIATAGTGACASPLVGGTNPLHTQLQHELADFLACDQVQLVPSGYQANLAAIAGLLQPGDNLVCDQHIHASIIDGARLARTNLRTFRHDRPDHLATVLAGLPRDRATLVAVEGVYSADGDLAQLRELCRVAHAHDALLLVDEAHSLGVLGPAGRGAVHHHNIAGEVDLVVGTLSKSLASTGGFIAGDHTLIDTIRHQARPLIFSAALPAASVAAAQAALQILSTEPQHRQQLWNNTHYARHRAHTHGFNTMNSETPILPILIGDEQHTLTLATLLQHAGIHITAGVHPMVPAHRSRLRLHITATHTHTQIDHALAALHTAHASLTAGRGTE